MAIQAEKTVSRLSWAYYAGNICGATLLSRGGVEVVGEIAKTEKLPNPESTTILGFKMPSRPIKKIIKMDALRSHRIKAIMHGVSEETTTGVKKKASGILLSAAINFDDSVTKSKYDSSYGCRPSLPDGLLGAKHFMFADEVGAIGAKDFMFADEVGALGAKDFMFADEVGAIGAKVFMFAHKVGAIGAKGFMFAHKVGVGCGYGDGGKPFCAGITGFAKGRLMNLGCATDHPVLSCLAQLELWNEKSGKYENREV